MSTTTLPQVCPFCEGAKTVEESREYGSEFFTCRDCEGTGYAPADVEVTGLPAPADDELNRMAEQLHAQAERHLQRAEAIRARATQLEDIATARREQSYRRTYGRAV